MPTVNAATSANMGMNAVSARSGLVAPGQATRKVGGLVGAANEGGTLQPMIKPAKGFTDLLAEYTDAKKSFETGMDTALGGAKNAAASLKSMDFAKERQEKTEPAAKKEEPAPAPKPLAQQTSPGEKTAAPLAKKREEAQEKADKEEERKALKAVEEFVDRYNQAAKFFAQHQDVSEHVASLASVFDDASRSVSTLSAIGVTSDEEGTLRVDTERLEESLRERPESVEYALGADGLAGRAEKSIDLASFNRDKLFPSISSIIEANRDAAKSMYSGQAARAQDDYASRGSMLNMYS